MLKTCSRCREEKPLDDFPGGGRGGQKKCYCKPCYVIHMREYYRRKPDKYARLIERAREVRVADPAKAMCQRSKHRAKKAGIEFTITPADLGEMPENCPVLGIKLDYGARGVNNPAAASLDRADNAKGYVPGNVVVVSFRANELKGKASLDELRRIVDFYSKR